MNVVTLIAALAGGAIALVLLVTVFRAPVKLFLKLAVNTLLGFGLLFLLNFLGKFLGISLGINLLNAVVVAVLGVPGVALLLMLKWIMLI